LIPQSTLPTQDYQPTSAAPVPQPAELPDQRSPLVASQALPLPRCQGRGPPPRTTCGTVLFDAVWGESRECHLRSPPAVSEEQKPAQRHHGDSPRPPEGTIQS